jgi:hypothetical protein
VLDEETCEFVRERAVRIHNLAHRTAAEIVEIGRYLTEVKGRLERKQFREWVRTEVEWGEDSVRNFMRVYERCKDVNFTDLEMDVSALYLIAAAHTPEAIGEEAIRRAERGERVTHATVRAVIEEWKRAGGAGRAVGELFDAVRAGPNEARRAASA